MSLNSNLKTKLQLDYPLRKKFKNNRNFSDFSLKSAHFFKCQFNGLLSNRNFDFKFEISNMYLVYFDIFMFTYQGFVSQILIELFLNLVLHLFFSPISYLIEI